MREIKFRAWDKKDKKIRSVITLYFEEGNECVEFYTGEFSTDMEIGERDYHKGFLREGDFTLMQYTGLKDKNGKEIYEGDIILSRENSEVYQITEIVPVHRHSHAENIGYYEGKKYHHRSAGGAYDNLDDWMSMTEFYEIIGNIYENPELVSKL